MTATAKTEKRKRLAMALSLWVGVGMLAIKLAAYIWTNSSAIFSDAAESIVHVVAVGFAYYSLRLARKPADAEHPFGHTKISFISAGFEGGMIIIAAVFIIYESISKWVAGLQLENLGTGLWLVALALAINTGLGAYLIFAGKRYSSLILQANGQHVLTDAWTSLGVLLGVGLAAFTGWAPFDPICAILVALHILYTGSRLVKTSVNGLLDKADPLVAQSLRQLLDEAASEFAISYHGLKHMDTGDGHRIEVHLLFDDHLTIKQVHRTATVIEQRIRARIDSPVQISTHLEPREAHEQQHTLNLKL